MPASQPGLTTDSQYIFLVFVGGIDSRHSYWLGSGLRIDMLHFNCHLQSLQNEKQDFADGWKAKA